MSSAKVEQDESAERQKCKEIIEERDQLKKKVAELEKERDAYLEALCALIPAKEELFAYVGKEPSLKELIAQLENDQEPLPGQWLDV